MIDSDTNYRFIYQVKFLTFQVPVCLADDLAVRMALMMAALKADDWVAS